ncbi:MAG: exonuclease domain-containing protein, partial [Pseudomonadota bacterium]
MSGRLSDWLRALQRRRLLRRLRDPAFRFLFEVPPPDEWVALDCETTGLDVRTDEIISIGAVRIVGNRILTSQRLELLIRPHGEMRPESICVHRLRNRDLDSGVSIEQA